LKTASLHSLFYCILQVRSLEGEKQSLTHRNKQLATKLADTLRDLASEKELNKGLTQNQVKVRRQ